MSAGSDSRVIWDSDDISRALNRIALHILESNKGSDGLLLLGIRTRGVPLAHRLGAAIEAAEGAAVPVGELDITMYRDDLRRQPTRAVGPTRIPVSVDGRTVVLVDDVLFSGRTIAAAMEALAGHPALTAYVARATARPAFQRALADHMAHWQAADARMAAQA